MTYRSYTICFDRDSAFVDEFRAFARQSRERATYLVERLESFAAEPVCSGTIIGSRGDVWMGFLPSVYELGKRGEAGVLVCVNDIEKNVDPVRLYPPGERVDPAEELDFASRELERRLG